MQRKAFLNSFIRRINIKDSEAEIEYTCPIGLNGNRRIEVLSMARIGSRGRARTESAVEALTVLLKEHQQLPKRPWLTTLNALVLLTIARLRHNTTILCHYTSPTPSLHFLTQFITHFTTQFSAQFVFESASWHRGKPNHRAFINNFIHSSPSG